MANITPLSSASVIERSDDFIEAELDGEVVGLNVANGVCYGLNRVGSRIWNLLKTPASIAEICSQLTKEFRVDSATCQSQVLDLLEEMRAEGMISAR